MKPPLLKIHRRGERGLAVTEFALVSILYVPLLLGVVVIGLNLGRSVQVFQFARDAGSMYSRGIDFSQTENKDLLVQLQALGMTASGGNGVVIFSKFAYVPPSACTGLPVCNSGQQVLVQRLTVGNRFLRPSAFATAGVVSVDAQGNVDNYVTDPNAVVTGLSPRLTLSAGEYAYTAEAYFSSPDLSSYGSNGGVLATSIF